MNWLQGYAYRTPFSFLMFIAAGAATIGMALLTGGFAGDEGGHGQSGQIIAYRMTLLFRNIVTALYYNIFRVFGRSNSNCHSSYQ